MCEVDRRIIGAQITDVFNPQIEPSSSFKGDHVVKSLTLGNGILEYGPL